MSETDLYELQCVLIALLAGGFFVALVGRWLRRVQPDLNITRPLVVAFGVRVLAALAVSSTSISTQLRGGDELTFLQNARSLARWDLVSTATLDGLTQDLHVLFFSMDFRVFEQVPDMMVRIQVIAVSVVGLALMAAAVHELAGHRAAVIAAWVLALEPSNVFFSGIIHKEPFMLLAEGLVAYGGALLWKRGNFVALVPIVLGCLIATATRSYVGWFLAAGAAIVCLHASFRMRSQLASVTLITVVVGLGIAFVPAVWDVSSESNLSKLQSSQDFNAADRNANLSLERVDYSSREKIIVNLPERVLDIVTKPYPWQLGNTSQQLGLVGTTFMMLGLLLLVGTLLQGGARLMPRAGPLVYPAVFMLCAYALSAGNAGTAFRYRTHLVAFLLAILCVIRTHRANAPAAQAVRTKRPVRAAVPHTGTS